MFYYRPQSSHATKRICAGRFFYARVCTHSICAKTQRQAGSDDAASMKTQNIVQKSILFLATIMALIRMTTVSVHAYASPETLTHLPSVHSDLADPLTWTLTFAQNEDALMNLSDFYQFPVAPEDFKGISTGFSRKHPGEDIRANYGAQVRAIQAGVVETVGYEIGGYGNYVVIMHDNGVRTLYAHLRRVNVEVGESVLLETIIGFVGSTGRSTGPHIHFEIRADGAYVNPARILPKTQALALK